MINVKKIGFLKKLRPVSFGFAMADMALLLLVFFMASTSTEPPKGVEVELPVAQTRGAEQDSLYITVSSRGEPYLDGKPISLRELRDSLAMRQAEKDRIVSITADRNLDYEVIANILLILQEQDFLNVVFISDPKKKKNRLQ